ncbi:hypothetical protein OEG84_08295 [Hoeflea sp. G2-23]|uniref:Transposase n=1 Tax=Hoeflea algicola TaxID=2983763 RepID=A0ABT3Z7H0_9HYPH|nr:hypothetical protein [Hoeflea algicola]MCY0147717.1 hypothetical protein [Hoeflea algicola]
MSAKMGTRSAFILADKQTHYKASKHAQSVAKEVKFDRIRTISFRPKVSSLSVMIWKIRSGFLVKTESYVSPVHTAHIDRTGFANPISPRTWAGRIPDRGPA